MGRAVAVMTQIWLTGSIIRSLAVFVSLQMDTARRMVEVGLELSFSLCTILSLLYSSFCFSWLDGLIWMLSGNETDTRHET